ncbi:hypothetical protein Tco_0369285 [Tanacetum coccineum]
MVNTRTDVELAVAVQAAVDAMLPQIREQVREEYRTGASGSNPPPVTIHTWLERFNKQKPRCCSWLRMLHCNLDNHFVTGIGMSMIGAPKFRHGHKRGGGGKNSGCWTRPIVTEAAIPIGSTNLGFLAVQGLSSSAGDCMKELLAVVRLVMLTRSQDASGHVFELTQDQPQYFQVMHFPWAMSPGNLFIMFLTGKIMKIISALKARTLLSHGCEGFLATIHDTDLLTYSSIMDKAIVSEFQDVFPEELPGIPPIRDVEFNIELIPGAEPISKAPYRMAPIELKELKDQYRSCWSEVRTKMYLDLQATLLVEWYENAMWLQGTGNWVDCLCIVEFAYNNKLAWSIKMRPFEMCMVGNVVSYLLGSGWERILEGREMIGVTNERCRRRGKSLRKSESSEDYADWQSRSIRVRRRVDHLKFLIAVGEVSIVLALLLSYLMFTMWFHVSLTHEVKVPSSSRYLLSIRSDP